MEGKMQELLANLGRAINMTLSDSEIVADALEEIKRAGYDAFLVLKCDIGLNRTGDNPEFYPEAPPPAEGTGKKPKLTAQDLKIMKSLRISWGDEPPTTPPEVKK